MQNHEDQIALINEISGLNDHLEGHMKNTGMSETQKDKIRAHMIEYKGTKPKSVALNEMAIMMYGEGR